MSFGVCTKIVKFFVKNQKHTRNETTNIQKHNRLTTTTTQVNIKKNKHREKNKKTKIVYQKRENQAKNTKRLVKPNTNPNKYPKHQ